MRIMVTGGAGYVGSVTAAHFLAAGHEVTVYDDLSRGYRAAVPPGAAFVRGDVGDRAALDAVLVQGFDGVVHFAALIEPGESMRRPADFFHNNSCASISLIDAAVAHGIPSFLFSSTAAVYAGKDQPLAEGDPIRPANVYGQTKHMVEEVLAWYTRLYGLRACALRYFNASGASRQDGVLRGEAHQPETHLIPLVLQTAAGLRPQIAIYGDDYPTPDGTCIRDYIHVDDLAAAHVLALEALADEGEGLRVHNLGNGQGYSNSEVIEVACRVTGRAIPTVTAPRRPGDAPSLIASSAKIRRELGWQPRVPDLEAIIASAWDWHLNYSQGYGSP